MAQSLSNILLHIVFSTKNRHNFIDEQIETELHSYLTSIVTSCGSYVHKINGVSDHIHIRCTLPRILLTSDLVEEMKKNSSKWIKTKGQQYSHFSWQKGFGAFSVSVSLQNAVMTYISKRTPQKTYFPRRV